MGEHRAGDATGADLVVQAGVATITLNAPHRRNALSAEMRSSLRRHLDSAARDESVRVVVLTHTGPVFCAGADLREASSGSTVSAGQELADILVTLMTLDKPVVARLAGSAHAGGVGLVAACDFAIASDAVTFAFSEVRLGVIPAVISVPLAARIAPATLHRLFLTAEAFTAQRAADLGLLSSVCPAAQLDEEVQRLGDALALAAPQALAGAKTLVQAPADELRDRFSAMQELSERHFSSRDGQEGMRAFLERRPPAWTRAVS